MFLVIEYLVEDLFELGRFYSFSILVWMVVLFLDIFSLCMVNNVNVGVEKLNGYIDLELGFGFRSVRKKK